MSVGLGVVLIGVGVLIVCLALAFLIGRASQTMASLTRFMDSATVELQAILPQVRQNLESVNEITAGVNSTMQAVAAVTTATADRVEDAGRVVRSVWRERVEGLSSAWAEFKGSLQGIAYRFSGSPQDRDEDEAAND